MSKLPKKLLTKLENRTEKNAFRSLPNYSDLIDFSSNDYLGLAKNENVFLNAVELLKEHNLIRNGATGSRLLTGNHPLYIELEKKLCAFHDVRAALVFNSGYDANIGFFSSVPQRGDVVFYDEYIHASIRDGIRMGNAKSYKFKHNDVEDLKSKISPLLRGQSRTHDADIYIVTESVFSMDGDTPDLKTIAEFCTSNNCYLVVDEAHAVGVLGDFGQGLVQELGLQEQVFARIMTFGKALGCHGAAVLGSEKLKSFLINFARSFIYSTGLSPHAIATIIVAYDYLQTTEGKKTQQKLKENIENFRTKRNTYDFKLNFIPSDSAIQSCNIEGNDTVKKAAQTMQENGFDVKPILSPTVPIGEERLRICLHAYNSGKQVNDVLNLLQSLM